MNRRALDVLLDGLAPSHDEGWAWLRKLHELGMDLTMDLTMDDPSPFPVFVGRGDLKVSLFAVMRAGSAMWLPLFAGEYLGSADTRTSGRPVFADPVTAAVWAETEVANLPPPPKRAMPGPAMPMPAPATPMSAPAQWGAPPPSPPYPWEPGSQ